jgi:SAM-dependent methyltransferase
MTSSANDHERADWTWARNLERRGGFWRNASWYDVHLERRLPLAKPMLEELVAALPPCDNKHVLDLLAGSGRATEALVAAYPTAFVTLVDASVERLSLAKQRLLNRGVRLADEQFLPVQLTPETLAAASPVPVDVVLGCLALHVLAENPAHYQTTPAPSTTPNAPETTSKEAVYEQLFRGVWALLKPGGHFLMGDHVGQLPLFTQLRLLHRVGFVDVDCAWRQTDFFVAGARKPLA